MMRLGVALLGAVAALGSSAALAQPADGVGDAGADAHKPPPAGTSEAPSPPAAPAAPEPDEPLLGPEPAKAPPALPAPSPAGAAAAGAKAAVAPPAGKDAKAAAARPDPRAAAEPASEVYAEDWWTLSRPAFELHGYYRVRAMFMQDFALGRRDSVKPYWPQPADNDYVDIRGQPRQVKLCGDSGTPADFEACESNSQGGADMRFRFNPELHISDNLRVRAQLDLLDNIVLGSTPQGYANQPGASGRYEVVARGGYQPLGAFASTQWAPVAGYNSTKDSIMVKRVWGEYSSPIGQLRFGRMPSHWGLGILAHSGDGYDSDWGSTADRLMFVTGYPPWDLYFAAAWDFANEGATSASLQEQQGESFDLSQKDDVDQAVFVVVRRRDDQLARKDLAAGKPVVEGGAYFVYRNQLLANDTTDAAKGASLGQDSVDLAQGYVRRSAEAVIPDAWLRFRYKKLRFEAEAALIYGSIENTLRETNNYVNQDEEGKDGWQLFQFGFATESEFRALEDRLKIQLGIGYATGDDDVASLAPLGNELQPQLTLDRRFTTFRFHPDYRVDLILFRNILTRVQGAYYFKPTIGYDFLREADGQKIGGDASLIYSRASEFVQTPGHDGNLGVELNFRLYYQAKDGVLNDDLEQMGGLFTSVEYGVLFPLDGLGYMPQQVADYVAFQPDGAEPLDTSTAHLVRWYVGILF